MLVFTLFLGPAQCVLFQSLGCAGNSSMAITEDHFQPYHHTFLLGSTGATGATGAAEGCSSCVPLVTCTPTTDLCVGFRAGWVRRCPLHLVPQVIHQGSSILQRHHCIEVPHHGICTQQQLLSRKEEDPSPVTLRLLGHEIYSQQTNQETKIQDRSSKKTADRKKKYCPE